MIILVQKSMLAQRLQAKTRAARRSPTMRSSASTGGRHFLTISLDTAGLRRRVWRAGISKTIVSWSSAIVFLLIMRIEIQWNSLFPLSMPYVTTLQYREIFWQNGSLLYWLGYRKAGVLHAAPTPPTVVAQAWFYIKSIVVLLLINTTTLQLQCFLLL